MDRKHKNLKIKKDPRVFVIKDNLKKVKRIFAVVSGKGGVGKSSVSSLLSLILKKQGYKVGLLDLDFQGPTCHIILNRKNEMPNEKYGIVPPRINGIRFFSIVYFSKNEPLALRGVEISDMIIEALTIIKWGDLDYLVIDFPPGLSDEILDLMRFVKRMEVLIVTTPSILALETIEKTIKLLKNKIKILGLIENMKISNKDNVKNLAKKFSVKYLGFIPFDFNFESSINNHKLLKTDFAKKLEGIVKSLK